MRTIGGVEFPDCREEVDAWAPCVRIYALHRCVLAVAVTRIEGTWACYVLPVEGMRHAIEWQRWEEDGNKQTEGIARALFPRFEDVPYAL